MSAATTPSGQDVHLVLALERYQSPYKRLGQTVGAIERLLAGPRYDVVVRGPYRTVPSGSALADIVQSARHPQRHDASTDALVHHLDGDALAEILPDHRAMAEASDALLARLTPYRIAGDGPSLAEQARIQVDDTNDRALAARMQAAFPGLVELASRTARLERQADTYWSKVGPVLQTTQAAIRDSLPRFFTYDATTAYAVFEPDHEPPAYVIGPDSPDADQARCERLWSEQQTNQGSERIVLLPITGPVAEDPTLEGLRDQIDTARQKMLDGHRAYSDGRIARRQIETVSLRAIQGVVAQARAQLAGRETRPVFASLTALDIAFVSDTGGSTLTSPTHATGDLESFRTLMGQARPAEIVLALRHPAQWPNLLNLVDAHPLIRRPDRVDRKPTLEVSGSTDVQLTRRPGLSGETRFEAMRLGEQIGMTIPIDAGSDSPFANLKVGEILRINEHKRHDIGAATDGASHRQIDVMITESARRISPDHLTLMEKQALAHREGLKPAAYDALLARKAQAITLGISVIAERRLTHAPQIDLDDDGGRIRAIVQKISRARGRNR